MLSGHLRKLNGTYYIVLNLYDEKGRRKSPLINTNLSIKESPKKANKVLEQYKEFFDVDTYLKLGVKQLRTTNYQNRKTPVRITEEKISKRNEGENLTDYLLEFIEAQKREAAINTYGNQLLLIKNVINPFFSKYGLNLDEIEEKHIYEFYDYLQDDRKCGGNSVLHYHALLSKSFKYAKIRHLITKNPMEYVIKPKKAVFKSDILYEKENEVLLKLCENTDLKIPVYMACFYGMRRSEMLGLKWSTIDFESDMITVRHSVTTVELKMELCVEVSKTKQRHRLVIVHFPF